MNNLLRKVTTFFQSPSASATHLENDPNPKSGSILDEYVTAPPSVSNAFKIFEGAWSSCIPGLGLGHAQLFEDHRIQSFIENCGGVTGKKVLELGPLEGGHTYMLSRAGAQVKVIESNTVAFLKCLIVKNALNFEAEFILGDFRPYLNSTEDTFDLLVASGVLYHMTEPWKLLQDMARVSQSIGIWTHYYSPEVILSRGDLTKKFEQEPLIVRVGTRDVISYKQRYLEALNWNGFCGGSAPESRWLIRDSLLGLLADLVFQVAIMDENKNHPNGPCMTLFYKAESIENSVNG
jgi:SAM-dependent methyltransferase